MYSIVQTIIKFNFQVGVCISCIPECLSCCAVITYWALLEKRDLAGSVQTERGLDKKCRENFVFWPAVLSDSQILSTQVPHPERTTKGKRCKSVAHCCLSYMAISRDSLVLCFILTIPFLQLPFQLPYCFDWCWSLSGDRVPYPPNSSQGGAEGVLKFSSNSRLRLLNRNILQAVYFWWEKLGVGVLADIESRQCTVGPNSIEVLGSQYCWYSSSGGSYSQKTSKEIICLTKLGQRCICCMKSGGGEVPSGGTGAQTILSNMLKSTSWKIVSMAGHKLIAPSPGSFQLVPVETAPEGFWSSWGHTLMWPWKYMQPSCSGTRISVTDKVSATW